MTNAKQTSKTSKKNLIAIIIIIGAVSVIGAVKFIKDKEALAKRKISQAKVKGDEFAPIKITEFIDLQCPACAHGVKLLQKYMSDNPKLIRLELKHFPLKMHQHGQIVARYAECAAKQDKFWAFEEKVIDQQDQWKVLFDAHAAFDSIAKDVGVDMNVYNQCLQDPKSDELVEKNKEEGKALGVQSTPTYFINGQMVVGTKNLELELDKLIAAQKN